MTTPTNPTTGKSPVAALIAGVEQMLAELPEDQWQQLVARVREPADQTTDPKAKPADDQAYPASWNVKGGTK